MSLLIIRHGEANINEQSRERELTQIGRDETKTLAKWLQKKRLDSNTIFHSTKIRAKQTAQIIADELSLPLKETIGICPDDSVESFCKEIEKYNNSIIVSHLPFVDILTSHLLIGSDEKFTRFTTSSACYLNKNEEGKWQIEWFYSPGNF